MESIAATSDVSANVSPPWAATRNRLVKACRSVSGMVVSAEPNRFRAK